MYHFNNIKKYKNLFIAKEIQAKVKHLTRRSLTLRLQIYHIFNYEKILSKPVLTNPISIPIFDLLSLNFSNDDDHNNNNNNNTGLLIFHVVTEPRNSGKSAKFTKTRKIPQNSVEILSNTWYVCTTYLKLISAIGAIYLP